MEKREPDAPREADVHASGATSCLGPAEAARFVEGRMSAPDVARVEQHLDACSQCRRYVSELVKATPAAPGPASVPGVEEPTGGRQLIGATLKGTYEIVRVIGSGGMGIVYEARHTRLPRRFAIKVLRECWLEQQALERFRREALVAAELGHRNVAPVLDFEVRPDGLAYLIMEYLEGEDLAARLRRGPMPPAAAAAIVQQIASALDVAHARGVVHRDLKPANIFICCEPDGAEVVKVLDFGMSKISEATSELTRGQSYLGTPYYMAPEQARGDSSRVDARADVFALGVIIFEMLVGQRPFTGSTVDAVLYQIVHEPQPALATVAPALPATLDQVLHVAMAKDRTERYPSAGELARALEQALAATSPSRRRAGALVAGLAAFALVFAGGLAALRPWAPRTPSQALALVDVRFEVAPTDAVVEWDGRAVADRVLRVPAGPTPHVLRVAAPGFVPFERPVIADRAQDLYVALVPLPPPASAAAAPAVPRPRQPPSVRGAGRRPPPPPGKGAAPPKILDQLE